MTRATPEADFDKTVCAIAKLGGFDLQYHFGDSRRQITDSRTGERRFIGDKGAKGWPDRVFINSARGVLVIAELKAQGKKATPEQLAALEALRKCGIAAYLWQPSDLPEIEKVLLRWVR